MQQKARDQLDALDRALDQLGAQLAAFSDEELNRAPARGGWTATQCLHHLILSEGGSQKYLEKKLSFKPELPRKGITDHLRRWLIVGYLSSPMKAKAPKGIGDEFLPAYSELEPTLTKWRTQRAGLRTYLASLDPELYDKLIFKHPFAGRISLNTTLDFFQAHFARHRRQALAAARGGGS